MRYHFPQAIPTARHQRTLRDHGYRLVYHVIRVRIGPSSGPGRSTAGPDRSRIFFWTGVMQYACLLTSAADPNFQILLPQLHVYTVYLICTCTCVKNVGYVQPNPLMCTGNDSATSNHMKLVHWPLIGGLFHLVPRGGDCSLSLPRPLLAVPNVTAHPSVASVPITVLLYSGPLLCSINVPVKGLIIIIIITVNFNNSENSAFL